VEAFIDTVDESHRFGWIDGSQGDMTLDAEPLSVGTHTVYIYAHDRVGHAVRKVLTFERTDPDIEGRVGEAPLDVGSTSFGDDTDSFSCGAETYCGERSVATEFDAAGISTNPAFRLTYGTTAKTGHFAGPPTYALGIADDFAQRTSVEAPFTTVFSDGRFQALGVKFARRILPYNVMLGDPESGNTNPHLAYVYQGAQAWIEQAVAQGVEPLVSFQMGKRAFGDPDGPVDNDMDWAPGDDEYRELVQKFLTRFPQVRRFTAWNEPNDGNQPTRIGTTDGPERAGRYFRILDSLCHPANAPVRCQVLAGDFADGRLPRSQPSSFFTEYLRRYRAAIGYEPSGWAVHLHSSTYFWRQTPGRDPWLEAFLNATKKKGRPVWITEAGVFTFKRSGASGAIDRTVDRPVNDNARTLDFAHLLQMAGSNSRIKRVYYYQWTGDSNWDTGLVKPGFGSARKLYDDFYFAVHPQAHLPNIKAQPDQRSATGDARFEFSVDEGTAEYECRLDNADWQACISPKTYTGLTEGDHQFQVRTVFDLLEDEGDGVARARTLPDPEDTADPAVDTWTVYEQPTMTAAPTVSGRAWTGEELTASSGEWAHSPASLEYQWQRCTSLGEACVDVPGATARAYALSASDIDHAVRVRVTATNVAGAGTAISAASPVVAEAPTNTVLPQILGTARLGWTLTAARGSWTGSSPVASDLQWVRCASDGTSCVNIEGANGVAYAVVAEDQGKVLRVRETVQYNGDPTDKSATSMPTSAVVNGVGTGGYARVSFSKDRQGVVRLRGLASASGPFGDASKRVIGTLPIGYRPANNVIQTAEVYDPGPGVGIGRIDVHPTGEIELVAMMPGGATSQAGAYVSLSSIAFPAVGATLSYTAPGLNAPWLNYGSDSSGSYQTAGHAVDSDGMVHLKGLVKAGSAWGYGTSTATITTLPTTARPTQTVLARALSYDPTQGYRFQRVDIDPTGKVTLAGSVYGSQSGAAGTWVSLDNIVFPAATNGLTWGALPYNSGWRNYGYGYQDGAYATTPDGIVYAKGLLQATASFAQDTTIAQLPASVRPDGHEFVGQLARNGSTDRQARIDTINDAQLQFETLGSSFGAAVAGSWVSLDTISWAARDSLLTWQPLAYNASVWGDY